MLSQSNIIPNSCSKGSSPLTIHGILQPREALEGRASRACMGYGVLQGLIWPTKEEGGGTGTQITFPGLQIQGGKAQEKQRLQETRLLLLQNIFNQPFPSGQTTELRSTSSQPTLQQHQEAAGKLHHKSTHSLEGSGTHPPLLPWSTNLSQSVPKEELPSRVEQHPHYSGATEEPQNSHASAQIASLNVIALSQFHEFNIVPRLLFA